MATTLPWDDLTTPDGDYNVKLVGENLLIPLFWGKNSNGQRLFILQFEDDCSKNFNKTDTSVRGIDVQLRAQERQQVQQLILTLEHQGDQDLFFGLCQTLIASLLLVENQTNALAVTLSHIKRWRAFLAGRKKHILSDEEIRGLFAEIQFLRLLIKEKLPEVDAINAWRGLEGSHQDFIYENVAIEIKSLSGLERNSVKISSEDQLESSLNNLFLIIYYLVEQPGSELSLSLNQLVRLIEEEICSSEALENLSTKLAAFGYIKIEEYDKLKLTTSNQRNYCVSSGFPKIVRSKLDYGVKLVRYEIELEKLETYECDILKVWSC